MRIDKAIKWMMSHPNKKLVCECGKKSVYFDGDWFRGVGDRLPHSGWTRPDGGCPENHRGDEKDQEQKVLDLCNSVKKYLMISCPSIDWEVHYEENEDTLSAPCIRVEGWLGDLKETHFVDIPCLMSNPIWEIHGLLDCVSTGLRNRCKRDIKSEVSDIKALFDNNSN